MAKSYQLPFLNFNNVAYSPLELVFSDISGPAVKYVGGFTYYVSFNDSYRKFKWIYLMKNKSDVESIFIQFQQHIERFFNKKILCVQSDWGGEYCHLNSFFNKIGIQHRVSCPHTHQQNGSVERKH